MRWLSYYVVVEVMSLDKSIVHGKEKRRHTMVQRLLTQVVGIMVGVTGV